MMEGIVFEVHKHFVWLGRQELDFYLPEYNIAIECQGKQHFEDGCWGNDGVGYYQGILSLDVRKNLLCKDNGIDLLYFVDSLYLEKTKSLGIYDKNKTFTDTAVLLDYILSV